MFKRLVVSALLLSAPVVFAQGKQVPNVRTPNEGGSRVYIGTVEDVLAAAEQACDLLNLGVVKAPDNSLFIATPNAFTRPVGGVSFTRTLIVRVRALTGKDVEVYVEEERSGPKDGSTDARINLFHEKIQGALGDIRPKKAIIPKHKDELHGEANLVRQTDLPSLKPAEDKDDLRTWNLAWDRSKGANTAIWKLSGSIPLHFNSASERRFLVLEGSVRMAVGTRQYVVGAGDFISVPRAVRTQLELEPNTRATLYVVELPAVDDSKTVWLEQKEAPKEK